MSKPENNISAYPCLLLPTGLVRCIWMTAGVLTYKLCRYNLDCESCSLHMALSSNNDGSKKIQTGSMEAE